MPSEKYPVFQEYRKELLKLLKKHDLADIFIFGSFAKGKSLPNDIDILIYSDKIEQEIKKDISSIIPKADIQFLKKEDIYSPIYSVLINEGYSIRKNEYLSKMHGLKPIVLFKYSLKKFSPVEKVQFTRGMHSILKQSDGKKLMRTVVTIPIKNKHVFEEFLKTWNIDFESIEYNLMPLLRKEEI